MASSARPDVTSRILKHERLIVTAGIAALVGLSWWFLLDGGGLGDHSAMAMPGMAPPPLTALVLMWWLMMVAMMLPSAAPAILLYARVRAMRGGKDIARTWIFAAGYLAVWLLFSLTAAVAQQALTGPSMALDSALAQGSVLLAAGLYQLTPVKAACLRQCRSPVQFMTRHWRAGAVGAARLGILHGAYCVGCCWLLMALLFVGGVMNFAWIALLTALVAAEKLVPRGDWIAWAAGIGFIAWAIGTLVG